MNNTTHVPVTVDLIC